MSLRRRNAPPGKEFELGTEYEEAYEWVFVRYGAKELSNMYNIDVFVCPRNTTCIDGFCHGTVDELVPCAQDLIDNVLHGQGCSHGVNEDGYYKVWRCR